jgi:hypothetical protein
MLLNLEKIHPKFRQITDLLFLSEKTDINLSNFKSLLRMNHKTNLEYLIDKYEKASQIFWENGSKLWSFRLNFLFSLKEKSLTDFIQKHIERRFFNLLKVKSSPHPDFDIEFIQFIEYCRYLKSKKVSVGNLKEIFLKLIPQTNNKKTIQTVKYLVPSLFKDMQEFGNLVLSNLANSSEYYFLLKDLREHGFKFNIKLAAKLVEDTLYFKSVKTNNYIIMALMNEPEIKTVLKTNYNPDYNESITIFLENCDFWLLDEKWIKNIINIIDIVPSMADDIAKIYIGSLYCQYYSHKNATSDKIIRLIKKCPQVNPKKVLVYLSEKSKMSDIKYLILAFPELKKLSAFV